MKKTRRFIPILFSTMLLLMTPVFAFAQANDGDKGLVPINGVPYYYEIHGNGEPLLLLQSGLGTFDMFRPILPLFLEG